jgi:hypothetical protein
LQFLHLGSGPLTGKTLSRLDALPSLEWVSLSRLAALSPVAAQELIKIRSLRQLYVSRTALTDADVEVLIQHKEWRKLTFSSTSVTDTSLRLVAGLPHLTHFDVDGECITSAGIQALSASQSLEWLDLRYCPSLDDAAVDALAEMPKLRKVMLLDKNSITPAAVKRLAKNKPKLLIQHPATKDWERHGWGGALIGTGWGRPDAFTVATAIAARTTTFRPPSVGPVIPCGGGVRRPQRWGRPAAATSDRRPSGRRCAGPGVLP